MRSIGLLLLSLALLVNQSYAWWPFGFGGWGGLGGWGGWGGYGWGYPYGGYYVGKRSVQDMVNKDRIECVFLRDRNMLSCNNGLAECQTVPQVNDLTTKFDLFGIELDESKSFNLYPKNFTSTFADCKYQIEGGKLVRLGIYADNDKNEWRGLMVKDKTCFDNLVTLFSAIKTPTIADITTTENKPCKASIIGFVL